MILTIGCDGCGEVIQKGETYVCGTQGRMFVHYHQRAKCLPRDLLFFSEPRYNETPVTNLVTGGDNNCHQHETPTNKPNPSDS